jgi:TetR/AcrR family transcriptional regulator, transcriptional repressor for nem operon
MTEASSPPQPATRKGRETRMRIVAAAADLIYTRGEAQTSIRDVKAAAGISGSQMTHYFPDRDALIHAVVEYRANEVIEFLDQPEIKELDTLKKLRKWGRLTVEAQRARGTQGGCVLGSLVAQLSERDEIARRGIAVGFEVWTDALADGIARIKKSGELGRRADPHKLAVGLLASLQGGYTMAQATQDIAPMDTAVRSAIAYIETFADPPSGSNRRRR